MKDESPPPAEAATEVGHEDGPESLGTLVLMGVAVVAAVGLVAFLVGVLV